MNYIFFSFMFISEHHKTLIFLSSLQKKQVRASDPISYTNRIVYLGQVKRCFINITKVKI